MSEASGIEMPEPEVLLEACSQCGELADVSGAMPIAKMTCPACGGETQVRKSLQNYLVESVLGSGGMGMVYKAFDVNLERHVALKVIRQELCAEAEQIVQFEREAQLTALVNDPNVVRVFSFGSDHGLLYIAMELVEKGSLNDLLELQGRVAEVQALEIGIQIAKGLHAAHQSGLLHRDVKPGNILFMDARTSKIVDFGLAQFMESEAEAGGSDEIWGTSYYIPPERLNRQPEDLRSDIYSLGATLFHAIAGRPPYEAKTASLVALKHLTSAAVSIQAFAPDVSGSTAFVINRMLQKNPDDRYQSYEELIEHMTFARDKLLERPAKSPGAQEHLVIEDTETQSTTVWVTLSALALAILCAVGLLFFTGNSKTDEQASNKPTAADVSYQNARALLLKGDYPGASKAFSAICATPHLSQPLGRWSQLHWGLACFLERKPSDALRIFENMYKAGMYSNAPGDAKLANFFMEMGRLASENKPISSALIKTYDSTSCEAMGLFLIGTVNWRFDKSADSQKFLEAYVTSEPKAPYQWIGDYKPLAQKLIAEINSRNAKPKPNNK